MYNTDCTDCTPIPYFSSDIAMYDNNATGSSDEDNGRMIEETKLAISQFRQSKSSSEHVTERGCFIATAAYGTFLDPHVSTLRKFRDRYLEPYSWGRGLMNFYYSNSPPIAAVIRQHEFLRLIVRMLLVPVVFTAAYPFFTLLLILFSGLAFHFRKRLVKELTG